MFFYLSKILGFFALPSNALIVLGLVGVAIAVLRGGRAGGRLIVASLVLLAILGLSPLANALILPLEQRFPPWDASRGAPTGMVVLGGAFDTLVSDTRADIPLNEAAERMTASAALARTYPQARLIFTGGVGALLYGGPTEGELARRFYASLGIAADRITIEEESRDTAENAILTKPLADPKPGERWLLVTSAYHMPRAVGAFRRVGFAVEAYPVDYRTRGIEDLARPFPSLGEGLRRGDTAVREWIGLVMYRLVGRTDELFPAP
ncbi:MAG TPA: YdcF family protein [Xanthobacteraceae bacterium]|nr:YdcF family protein [Xanthobacteraceae bacterium]